MTDFIETIKPVLMDTMIKDGSDKPQRANQRSASVLIPLVKRKNWQIIFTKRPDYMPTHAGQISFPGGRAEDNENALDCALRETNEEIGVPESAINVLGRLPSFDSVSNYRVTPFVGIISHKCPIIPCPNEVDELFELPFDFFMDKNNHIARKITYEGKSMTLYDMPWPDKDNVQYNVWGMTAMMIYQLYQRLLRESLL